VTYEDGRPVEGKGVGRKVIDRVKETYDSELSGKDFAYDGEKSLFTVGSLPRNKLEFTVVLEDVQSNRYTIRVCDSFILGILYYCQFISNFEQT
jgi:eukaryotic translation initiation factor 2C